MTITENGSCRFVVTDTAGNTTTRDLSVDWFSATLTESTDPGAPEITAQLTKEDGTPIPATVPGDMQVMLKVTDGSGNAVEATISQYQYNDPKSPPASTLRLARIWNPTKIPSIPSSAASTVPQSRGRAA